MPNATAQPLAFNSGNTGSFAAEQLRHQRVMDAKYAKDKILKAELMCKDLPTDFTGMYIRAFKKEGVVEIWIKDRHNTYRKFKEYTICVSSGKSGPKRRQGDRQVPEGFYYINKFNPNSSYHLSLGVNYPNASDKILGRGGRLGGSIFIHGNCMTAGCLPVTDDKMKEIYWLAVQAKSNGQARIPVNIFPYKFHNITHAEEEITKHRYHNRFWENLEEGYQYFETHRRPPEVSVGKDGLYRFY